MPAHLSVTNARELMPRIWIWLRSVGGLWQNIQRGQTESAHLAQRYTRKVVSHEKVAPHLVDIVMKDKRKKERKTTPFPAVQGLSRANAEPIPFTPSSPPSQ